ncbi:serine--tRNA ligase [Candidatus Peribacteria bacterium]|nr:serine--tRNA ligase [Candidatus Peribacteria bacterium]
MIDIVDLRARPDAYQQAYAARQLRVDIASGLVVDEQWRALTTELDAMRQQRNAYAKARDIEGGQRLSSEIKAAEERLAVLTAEREHFLYSLPNLPLEDVPIGKDETDNVEVTQWGTPREFAFPVRDHVEIGQLTGTIDIEMARKTSGARFAFLKGKGALLEYAIMRYMLEKLLAKGFTFVIPPTLLRGEILHNAGSGPGTVEEKIHAQEMYTLPEDNLGMIGTAEHAMANMHLDQTLEALPLRYAGWSSCYRREAGAAGKDTNGILRVHEFQKLEMFTYCAPEESPAEHALLIETAQELWRDLGIPHRVLLLCTGDIGWASAKTYDIEAWIPSQHTYREVVSGSTCTDFQSRRTRTRYTDAAGNKQLVHTLNATAVAVQRCIIAIYENYQNADGSVTIPTVLRPYTGFDTISVA